MLSLDHCAAGVKGVKIDGGRLFYRDAADDIETLETEGGQNATTSAHAGAEMNRPKRQAPQVEIDLEVAEEGKAGFLEPF